MMILRSAKAERMVLDECFMEEKCEMKAMPKMLEAEPRRMLFKKAAAPRMMARDILAASSQQIK